MLARKIVNNEISHENFTTNINEEKNYRKPKESIRITKSQRSDTERNNLIEKG